jgi:two-component system, NtrC family, sensor kinase
MSSSVTPNRASYAQSKKGVTDCLHLSEKAALSTLDALSTEIAILDDAGTILMVNRAWRAFAEAAEADAALSCEGVNYIKVLEAVDPESGDKATADAFMVGIRAVLWGEQDVFAREYPCHSPNEQRWYLGKITRFDEGGVPRLVVAHENITERKLAELAMQEAHEELDRLHQEISRENQDLEQKVFERTAHIQRLNDRMLTILSNTHDAIILVDGENHIESTNLAFDRLFGYDRDETFGQPLRLIASAESEAVVINMKTEARHTQQSQRFQIVAQCKDGRTFDADVALAYVADNGGHMVCSVRDITALKEIDRAKDKFLSMVSHELRTPVTAIVLSAESLKHYFDRLTDERKQQKITQILDQAAQLTELMTSILESARFDARKSSENRQAVDVARALKDVLRELTPQAEVKGQALTSQIADTTTSVLANHIDIGRVWRNLLANAIKYTGEQGIIRASLLTSQQLADGADTLFPTLRSFNASLPTDLMTNRYVIGCVEDNGPGIHADDLPHLFTRFFRGWAANTDIPGTGLGLSLVREILQSYGGDIAVQSATNVGTTFCFWLPMSSQPEASN